MKKVNPRKRPCTEADVNRAKVQAVDEAVRYSTAIILTVLADKFNGADYIPEIWHEVNKLSQEIKEHRISVQDLIYVLRTEYNVEV